MHDLAARAVLAEVARHPAGILFESRRSHANLARAMLTGVKKAHPGNHPVCPIPARVPLAVFSCCWQPRQQGRRCGMGDEAAAGQRGDGGASMIVEQHGVAATITRGKSLALIDRRHKLPGKPRGRE